MKFVCWDISSGNLIFQYTGPKDTLSCETCLIDPSPNCCADGLCKHGNFCLTKHVPEESRAFRFCISEAKTRKKANYYANLGISAYFATNKIGRERVSVHKNATELAVHNTRNLNAEINSKLLSLVNDNDLTGSEDKIQYIQDMISKSPKKFAREFLSILKSTGQIMSEYDVIDLMHPSASFSSADFQMHRIHTLCVMSFYLFEQEFKNKGIRVRIDRTEKQCSANFSSARTAISQILDNGLKYCKPNTDIVISFNTPSEEHIELSLEMTSLYFNNENRNTLTLPGARGKYAEELNFDGKGAGLGIVQRMMELNRGYFLFESFEPSIFYSDRVPYSTNRFVLGFLRKRSI